MLYSCRGRGGQEIGRIGQESKTGCRRKRIIRNMQRISQRTALTVIFGIAGRMDVPKKNAIIGFCRRNLLKRKRRLGAVRDALWKIFSLHRVLPAEDSAGNKTEESSQGEGR